MRPKPGVVWPAPWRTAEERLGEFSKLRVLLEAECVVHVSLLEGRAEALLGESGVSTDCGDVRDLIDSIENGTELRRCSIGGVDVAGAKSQIEQQRGSREEDRQRMEASATIVTVVGGARLMPVYFEGEGVDVENGAGEFVRTGFSGKKTACVLEERGPQGPKIGGRRKDVEEAGLRGLRRESFRAELVIELEGGDPSSFGDGEPTSGVVAKEIGITLEAVSTSDEVEACPKELHERMNDTQGAAIIIELARKGGGEAETFVDLPQGESPCDSGEAFRACLDGERAVERTANRGRLILGHRGPLAFVMWIAHSIRKGEGFV